LATKEAGWHAGYFGGVLESDAGREGGKCSSTMRNNGGGKFEREKGGEGMARALTIMTKY